MEAEVADSAPFMVVYGVHWTSFCNSIVALTISVSEEPARVISTFGFIVYDFVAALFCNDPVKVAFLVNFAACPLIPILRGCDFSITNSPFVITQVSSLKVSVSVFTKRSKLLPLIKSVSITV